MTALDLANIIVATDDSPGGRHAVRLGRTLAARADADLAILRVCPPPVPGAGRFAGASVSSRSGKDHPDLDRLKTWLGTDGAPAAGIDPELIVAFGVPGIEITRQAAARPADLVVMGRKPRGPDRPLVLGRTADAVVRRSAVPTLFLSPERPSLARFVIALSGDRRSVHVLGSGLGLAATAGAASVDALTIEPKDHDPPGAEGPVSAQRLRVRRLLDGYVAGHPSLPAVGLLLGRGPTVEGVLNAVVDATADVLVIGYRLGGPSRLVRPSETARNLLYSAPTNILTVPL